MINYFFSSLFIFLISTITFAIGDSGLVSLLDPEGSYIASQVDKRANTEHQMRNCPAFEYSRINITKYSATINDYVMPFIIWNKGEDEYWSLGEIIQTETTFHYQTRGMLDAETTRNFKLISKAPKLFHLYLTIFIPFETRDIYGAKGEICHYKMEIIKMKLIKEK